MKIRTNNRFFAGFVCVLLCSIAAPAWAQMPTEVAKLLADDGVSGDTFGYSVAVAGDTAVIGAVGDDDNGDTSGSVYVFTRDGAGNWSQQAKLTASDATAFHRFGHSVAVAGDTAVIAANGDGDNGIAAGAAYVFTRDGAGNWSQQAKLTASDAAASDRFGRSVAAMGDTAVIGSPDDDNSTGSAYVFTRDGAGNWSQQTKLTAADATAIDHFGGSVAVTGDTAVIGSTNDNDGLSNGSAYVFTRDGAGNWSQLAKLTASDSDASGMSYIIPILSSSV